MIDLFYVLFFMSLCVKVTSVLEVGYGGVMEGIIGG